MKFLYSFLIIFFFSANCFAKKNQHKKHHLNYEEYVAQYGTNDTSIAIINLFFDKRDYNANSKMSFFPITTTVTLIAPPIGIPLMVMTSPLLISGMFTRSKYSHKNLLIALNTYQNQNLLSDRFKKIINRVIKNQKDIYNEELIDNRSLALKEIYNY